MPQLTSQTSAPLQREGVNKNVSTQADKSSPFAKRTAMPAKKKKSMGQRMMGRPMMGQTAGPASSGDVDTY